MNAILRLCLVVLLYLALNPSLSAEERVQLLFSTDANPANAREDFKSLALRPNNEQAFHVFVRNSTKDELPLTLTITGRKGTTLFKLAETDLKINARKSEQIPTMIPVVFKPDMLLPEQARNLEQARELIFTLKDIKKAQPDDTKTIVLSIMKPEDYLSFKAKVDARGQLIVTIDRRPGFRGPPCTLELDCTRLNNCLTPLAERTGALKDEIDDQEKSQAVLTVHNLQFKRGTSDFGFFAIKADGLPRAKLFVTSMEANSSPKELEDRNVIRFVAPRFFKPDPKNDLTVSIEVDNVTDNDAKLSYKFDRSGTNDSPARMKPSARQQIITAKVSDKGVLVFNPLVSDWKEVIKTEGLNGPKKLTAELLDTNDKQLAQAPAHEIIFSNKAPKITRVELADPLRTPKPGETVKVIAQAESDTGITKAFFFLGDSPPAEPAKLTEASQEGNTWTASLNMPETKGRLRIGVVFENGLGLTAPRTFVTTVAEPTPPSAKPGSIKAEVVQGVDDRPQQGANVELLDAKGTSLKTGATNEKGLVHFKDLPAGNYILRCIRNTDKVRANSQVTVENGEEATVRLSLKR